MNFKILAGIFFAALPNENVSHPSHLNVISKSAAERK